MSSDDDDLFGSSGDDTDDLIAASKKSSPPVAKKKRLQKKTAAPTTKPAKKKNIPDADNDDSSDTSDDDDGKGLFDDSSDEEDDTPKKPKALSKRQRMEALQAKRRQEQGAAAATSGGTLDSTTAAAAAAPEGDDKGYDSAASFDSAQYVRTKEDNDFIDMDDDDPDAIQELYAEQNFGDRLKDMEDNEGEKKKKSRKRGGEDMSDDEDDEPENPIMAAVHRMKKKKRVAKKLSEMEEEAKEFLQKMELAAEQDELAIRERRPATKKLAILQQVTDMLARRDMMRLLLDFDVLSVCRRWIQPLQPSGALGNVTVRQRMVQAVGNMTGEQGITANDLKRSEFGKVVMTLYMHKSETPTTKKELKRLIEQWSRPIFSKSGNMKDLEHAHASRREAGLSTAPRGVSASSSSASASRGRNEHDLQNIIAGGSKGGSKEGLRRVSVPFSKGFQYTVRPQNKIGDVADKRMDRGTGAADTRGTLSKRIVEKGRAVSKNQRSANISIEGRPTK